MRYSVRCRRDRTYGSSELGAERWAGNLGLKPVGMSSGESSGTGGTDARR